MNLEERIKSFALLGELLRNSLNGSQTTNVGNGRNHTGNGRDRSLLDRLIDDQHNHNPWFTPENVRQAVHNIAEELTEDNLIRWTGMYPEIKEQRKPSKVGVIMAGNIPLVGFHDFLSVLITGNKLIAKTSSKDYELIVYISNILCSINPGFKDYIEFTEGTIANFDAVIATGSENSSRYFEYYFGRYPNIIRRNRNSIAIIEGDETDDEMERLGTDIFSYFGLGCRNVSKLFFPAGYDFKPILKHWGNFEQVIRHQKYSNNYDFNKAVFIVNKEDFYDAGHFILKEDTRVSSPVSVLYYEYYESQTSLKQLTESLKEKIQCIVGRQYIPFGKAQSPHLWDYADGIDTIEFLLKKNIAGIL